MYYWYILVQSSFLLKLVNQSVTSNFEIFQSTSTLKYFKVLVPLKYFKGTSSFEMNILIRRDVAWGIFKFSACSSSSFKVLIKHGFSLSFLHELLMSLRSSVRNLNNKVSIGYGPRYGPGYGRIVL